MASQAQYNSRLDEINTIRQGAIVSSGLQRNGAEVAGAQKGYAWAVHRDGAATALAASAPERGACFKAVEALQANLKKMPVAVLTDAEKAQFDHLSAAWTAFLDIDAKATQAYGGGSEGRAAGDALLSKDAANTFNRAVTAAAGLNGAINTRVAGINALAFDDAQPARNAQIVILLITSLTAALVTFSIVRGFRHDLEEVDASLAAVASGDLTRAPQVAQGDELGRIAASAQTAITRIHELIVGVRDSAAHLNDASSDLSRVSDEVNRTSDSAAGTLDNVSTLSAEVTQAVQTVSAGTEEMTSSIRQIAQNAQSAARVAASAVQVADQTNADRGQAGWLQRRDR